MIQTKIPPEVLDVLRRSTITANSLTLPRQLERKLYEAVNKVIANAGGKWKKGPQHHAFDSDPRVKLGLALETGVTVNEQQRDQAFYTPTDLAMRLVNFADIQCHQSVLEPSAGAGALVAAVREQVQRCDLTAVEQNQSVADALSVRFPLARVVCRDFLECRRDEIGRFDRVVMNPPFTRGADMVHIQHALRFLHAGSRLAAICAAGEKQRAMFEPLGQWIELGAGAFKESGTPVNTAIVLINT